MNAFTNKRRYAKKYLDLIEVRTLYRLVLDFARTTTVAMYSGELDKRRGGGDRRSE